jgi:homoserine dehydrogenase
VAGRYYLRFNVADRPAVLAEIAGVLGRHKISIASVIQHDSEGRGETTERQEATVPLMIMTHQTTEGAVGRALESIDQMEFLRGGSVRMRVLN